MEIPIDGKPIDAMTREELLEYLQRQQEEGIRISFSGKEIAKRIARKVQPRTSRRVSSLCVGSEEDQARNLVIEGENLQAMVSLYRERGQVDLILADPPYNTGRDFRYNDRWEEDPNDDGLGDIVPSDDGASHTKWMRFMYPRLQVMKAMLRPMGVIAICIDHRELFRLGQMLDEVFSEKNRIAIINWQRSYTPRNDSRHVSIATEYVLVYAKDIDRARTGLLPRPESEYGSPDGDPRAWTDGPATGSNAKNHKRMVYAIQSPFTGEFLYPPDGSAWRFEQGQNLEWLRGWGVKYKAADINDLDKRAAIIGVSPKEAPDGVMALVLAEPLKSAQKKANALYANGPWPRLFFLNKGQGRLRFKKYPEDLKQGFVPTTFWEAEEDYYSPQVLGSVSWRHQQSGHSEQAADELTAIVGPGHDFKTVKPLKLFQKIVQLWCPPGGLVLDPFAGSGTSGHAVLVLNRAADANRRFILIEQGRPERGDSYARTLLQERLRNVVTGKWSVGKQEPLGGGFRFIALQKQVDAKAVLGMERDEMTDAVVASHVDANRRGGQSLIIMTKEGYGYLVARNDRNEGFYLVWNGSKEPPVFDENVYDAVVKEAIDAGLKPTYHVYARFNFFQSDDVRFYQIPDQILMDFGLSVNDPFNIDAETATNA